MFLDWPTIDQVVVENATYVRAKRYITDAEDHDSSWWMADKPIRPEVTTEALDALDFEDSVPSLLTEDLAFSLMEFDMQVHVHATSPYLPKTDFGSDQP